MHNPWAGRAAWAAIILFFGAGLGAPVAIKQGWIGPGPSHEDLANRLRRAGVSVVVKHLDDGVARLVEPTTGRSVLVARAPSSADARQAYERLGDKGRSVFVSGRFVFTSESPDDYALLARIRGTLD